MLVEDFAEIILLFPKDLVDFSEWIPEYPSLWFIESYKAL